MPANIVDASSPDAIKAALRIVNKTPKLHDKNGLEILWRLLRAPDHTLPYDQLVNEFGAPNLNFGWFCRRVAEQLGEGDPDEYALVDQLRSEDGSLLLKLKASVVEAMSAQPKGERWSETR